MEERVILVDERDQELGHQEKLKAHELGLLHRAFSVFLFSADGKCLLQKRAATKYHAGGLWSNACCSHPRPGETIPHAIERRLAEELGISANVTKLFEIQYDLDVGGGLREHEYNHTYVGVIDEGQTFDLHDEEVSEVKWSERDEILQGLETNQAYTNWFRYLFPKVTAHIE